LGGELNSIAEGASDDEAGGDAAGEGKRRALLSMGLGRRRGRRGQPASSRGDVELAGGSGARRGGGLGGFVRHFGRGGSGGGSGAGGAGSAEDGLAVGKKKVFDVGLSNPPPELSFTED
jgi:hypothetical protein